MQVKVRIAFGVVVFAITAMLSVVHVTATEAPLIVLRALDAQRQLVRDQPSDAAAHNDLGNLLTLAGEHGAAENAYRRALDIAPNLDSARFNLGLLLQQRGNAQEAVDIFREVLERRPKHAWAMYQIGVDLERRGERKAAVDHYARAFAVDSSLTFAENNPHIIENRLVTKALLRAQRYVNPPGAQTPRQYGDGDRIAKLILMEDADEEPEAEAEEEEPAQTVEPVEPAGSGDAFFDDEDDEGYEDEEEPQGRVLSAEDLDASSTGQATRLAQPRVRGRLPTSRNGGPGGVLERYRRSGNRGRAAQGSGEGTAERPDPAAIRRQLLRTANGGSGSLSSGEGSNGRDEATARQRFIPSRRSTSQLDLELRPVTEPTLRATRR